MNQNTLKARNTQGQNALRDRHIKKYMYKMNKNSNTGKLNERKYILEGNIESSPVREIERKTLSIYRLFMYVYT